MKQSYYFFNIIAPLCLLVYAQCLPSERKQGQKRTAQEMSISKQGDLFSQTGSESLEKKIKGPIETSRSQLCEQKRTIRAHEMKRLKTAQIKKTLSSLQCPVCFQVFVRTGSVLDHYLAIHVQADYSCVSCDKNMKWSPFIAHRCGEPTKRRKTTKPAEWHKQQVQEIRNKTRVEACAKQVILGLLPRVCPDCNLVAKIGHNIPTHYLHKHGGNAGMYTCAQCNTTLKWRAFTKHICPASGTSASAMVTEESKKTVVPAHSNIHLESSVHSPGLVSKATQSHPVEQQNVASSVTPLMPPIDETIPKAQFPLKPGSALAMLTAEPLAPLNTEKIFATL